MAHTYWLFKSEPGDFSIEDLRSRPEQTEPWDGVRNYQARNYLRDAVKLGDHVLLYHSGARPAVVGTARVRKEGYPDRTALDPESKHFDPRSTPDRPIWYVVDVQLDAVFPKPIPLSRLRTVSGLESMLLLRKGMRLSIQPVTEQEFKTIEALARQDASDSETARSS
ncbi:MAG: EVE domain-containing protein [Syntrophobacteraceae bacterium]